MKNPLLQLTAWAAARLLQAAAEWDPCPLPSRPRHPPPSEPLPIAPTHPHLGTHPPTPHHFPRITCTEISVLLCTATLFGLCVVPWVFWSDIVLFIGHQLRPRRSPLEDGGSSAAAFPFPESTPQNLYSFLFSCSFFKVISWGRVGEGLSFCSIRSKSSADYCRYDFVLEKYTVISESVGTCSRA